MKTKAQGGSKKITSLAIDPVLIEIIDARAESLRMNRSEYFCNLALQDLETLGPVIVKPNYGTDEGNHHENDKRNS